MSSVGVAPSTPRMSTRLSKRTGWLLHTRGGVIGSTLLCFVLAVAFIGPLVAPHSITQPLGIPGASPSSGSPLGTDFLGRDVLSRVLHGGLPVVGLAFASIGGTYLIALAIGMTAGLSHSVLDPILMRIVDIFMVFPPILLMLILLTGAGSGIGVLIVGIVMVLFPGASRIIRTATLEVSTTGYVEAAVARGESRLAIMQREVLPNVANSILADLGVRFSASVILAASVNFLGLGSRPPAANWGLMIAENRSVVATNPLALVAPALLLAALTVAVNLLSDAFVNSHERGGQR